MPATHSGFRVMAAVVLVTRMGGGGQVKVLLALQRHFARMDKMRFERLRRCGEWESRGGAARKLCSGGAGQRRRVGDGEVGDGEVGRQGGL